MIHLGKLTDSPNPNHHSSGVTARSLFQVIQIHMHLGGNISLGVHQDLSELGGYTDINRMHVKRCEQKGARVLTHSHLAK